jgi:hypothetical protein
VTSARKARSKLEKVTDESSVIRCMAGDGLIRIEEWKDGSGKVVRFNLAFINFHLFPRDNGRVLGYDTAHGYLHRHFAGAVELIEHAEYDVVFERFIEEVQELKIRRRL